MTEKFAFDQTLGAIIGKTGKMMAKTLNQHLKEGGQDLSLEQYIVLVHLWARDGRHQQELAEIAGRDKTSVTRAIDWLEQHNLVVRVPDREDRRHNLIYLTYQGKSLKEEIKPIMLQVLKIASDGIPEAEMETCKAVLNQVFKNLTVYMNETPC